MRKRRGFGVLDLAIYAIMISLLAVTVTNVVGSTTQSVGAGMNQDQALAMDSALGLWYGSHGGVYPADLSTLRDMGFVSKSVDLSLFTYVTQNGGTQYRLTVKLPDGSSVVSPGSKY